VHAKRRDCSETDASGDEESDVEHAAVGRAGGRFGGGFNQAGFTSHCGENRRQTHRRKSSSNVQKLPTTAMT
jgi:hypothetical protein